MPTPSVTLICTAYNVEDTIAMAVQSVLSQSFSDFELWVVDDGSQDGTPEILHQFHDPRLRVICNPKNQGISGCKNQVFPQIESPWVGFMDGDDILPQDHLQYKVQYLSHHRQIQGVGTGAYYFSNQREPYFQHLFPPDHPYVKASLLFTTCIWNPSTLFSLKALQTMEKAPTGAYYQEDLNVAEDFDFWVRFCQTHRWKNLNHPDHNMFYRIRENSTSRNPVAKAIGDERVFKYQLEKLLGSVSAEELAHHAMIISDSTQYLQTVDSMMAIHQWMGKLLKANHSRRLYDQQALSAILWLRWFKLYRTMAPNIQEKLSRFGLPWGNSPCLPPLASPSFFKFMASRMASRAIKPGKITRNFRTWMDHLAQQLPQTIRGPI